MDTDTVTPLCSYAQFTSGAFQDLVSGFSQTAVTDILLEATRQCEDQAGRRLAPFTVTETTRAQGIDSVRYSGVANIPVSIQGTVGMSEAAALDVSGLVQDLWLSQYPPRYPDLWAYSNVTVTVVRAFGGTQQISGAQILDGPDDTGHLWFLLGTFVPQGSRLRATYSGGYTVATPASLKRACEFLAASVVIDELNPENSEHDPDRLYELALRWLVPFARDGSPLANARLRG